jgi:ubiquinone/menaquinone biosynthesis C-methylase UbiE
VRTPSKPGRIDRARSILRKFAFESLYGPFAWAYDWVSRTFFLGQWRRWQRASIHHIKGTRVLEVGMGTGNLQIDLERAGFQPYGVDLSAPMLRQATRKARRLGLALFRAIRAQAQALPFADSSFDTAVSTFPNEYIADPQTLGELARVLRPGGRLVVVPGGWLHPRDTGTRSMEGVARLVYGYGRVPTRNEVRVESIEQFARRESSWYGWMGFLSKHMVEAGFMVSTHIHSNERGACLIIVADKGSPERQ